MRLLGSILSYVWAVNFLVGTVLTITYGRHDHMSIAPMSHLDLVGESTWRPLYRDRKTVNDIVTIRVVKDSKPKYLGAHRMVPHNHVCHHHRRLIKRLNSPISSYKTKIKIKRKYRKLRRMNHVGICPCTHSKKMLYKGHYKTSHKIKIKHVVMARHRGFKKVYKRRIRTRIFGRRLARLKRQRKELMCMMKSSATPHEMRLLLSRYLVRLARRIHKMSLRASLERQQAELELGLLDPALSLTMRSALRAQLYIIKAKINRFTFGAPSGAAARRAIFMRHVRELKRMLHSDALSPAGRRELKHHLKQLKMRLKLIDRQHRLELRQMQIVRMMHADNLTPIMRDALNAQLISLRSRVYKLTHRTRRPDLLLVKRRMVMGQRAMLRRLMKSKTISPSLRHAIRIELGLLGRQNSMLQRQHGLRHQIKEMEHLMTSSTISSVMRSSLRKQIQVLRGQYSKFTKLHPMTSEYQGGYGIDLVHGIGKIGYGYKRGSGYYRGKPRKYRKAMRKARRRSRKVSRKLRRRSRRMHRRSRKIRRKLRKAGRKLIRAPGKMMRKVGRGFRKVGKKMRKAGRKMRRGLRKSGKRMRKAGKKIRRGFRKAGKKMRKAGKKMRRGFRKAGRKMRKAGRKVRRSFRKAGRKVGRPFRKAGKKMRKAGKKMRRGFRKAGRKVRRGFRKAGKKMKKAGKKISRPFRKAGRKVGRGLRKAGKKISRGFRKAGRKIRKAGKKVGRALDPRRRKNYRYGHIKNRKLNFGMVDYNRTGRHYGKARHRNSKYKGEEVGRYGKISYQSAINKGAGKGKRYGKINYQKSKYVKVRKGNIKYRKAKYRGTKSDKIRLGKVGKYKIVSPGRIKSRKIKYRKKVHGKIRYGKITTNHQGFKGGKVKYYNTGHYQKGNYGKYGKLKYHKMRMERAQTNNNNKRSSYHKFNHGKFKLGKALYGGGVIKIRTLNGKQVIYYKGKRCRCK